MAKCLDIADEAYWDGWHHACNNVAWIMERFLDVPENVKERVQELIEMVAEDASK